jgi:multidrug efflux pump subunit AcrA (membrane-fusion protein)
MARTFFIIVGLDLILLCGCSKVEEKEATPVVPVQVAEARREVIQRTITADGILRALDQSTITPKISAPVREFRVNRGDHVQKGQLLAVLENRDLAAAVADTKGAYDQAAAAHRSMTSATVPDELVKAQTEAQAAKQSLDAAQKLLASREKLYQEGALARRQVDEAGVAYAQAKGQSDTALKHLESVQNVTRIEDVKGAAGQLDSAKGKHDAAQAQLSYSEILSPISGIVADRPLFPGEMANAGSPLLTVMDVSSVIARVNIPPAQAAFVKVGQSARIVSADSSVEVEGKVTVVSPAVDPQSTTVEVWVQAANPGERLRPGGTVRVTIMAGAVPDAVVVPPEALLPGQAGGSAVIVVGADSIAHEHKVETGVRSSDKVQILTGIAAGDRVVTVGGVGLQDGAKVSAKEAGGRE